jgi:hypothetical protein
MRSTDVFPSKYLKAEELDEDVQVTIKKVVLEELEQKDGQKADKPVCYFEEGPKGLILNKTNWALIAKQHGDESDEWAGKTVILTTVDVDAFGDVVSAIRIKPPKKQGGGTAFPKAAKPGQTTPTEFWSTVKKAGLSKDEGKRALEECGGDFDKALGAVEQLIPPADARE